MLRGAGSAGGRALPLPVPTPRAGPALQNIYLSRARPTLCPGLPLTGPFVSNATLSGLCPDTLFRPQPSLAGPCPVPSPTLPAFPALLTAPGPWPLLAASPTLGTALAPEAQRTLAAECVPLVHTGAPVVAGTAVTHVLLGRAA